MWSEGYYGRKGQVEATRTASVKQNNKPKVMTRSLKIAAISTTIKNLKDAGIVIFTTFPFHLPIWPVKKTDGSWGMTINYHKHDHVVTPIVDAVPDVVK